MRYALIHVFSTASTVNLILQASDMTFAIDPSSVIPWVTQAMKNLLNAASKTPTIKRVVLVSSSSAAYDLHPDPEGREIDTRELRLF